MSRVEVSKLPVDPGPAGWNCLLPEPAIAQQVEGQSTADWIVIGAGYAGLSAARRLTQLCPGDRITVLEAHRVGQGPGGRNSGFMIDLPHDLSSSDYGGAIEKDLLLTADNRHAIDFAGQMARDFGLGPDVFARSGKINGAATENGDHHNSAYSAHLKAMGESSEMLDASEMQVLTGTDFYRSGLFTPGTAMIQPAAYVRGVARGLASDGVTIYENSPVTELTRDREWTARAPLGAVTAPKVILAVNGHLNSFGFMQRRLMHVFTYASMTRPLGPEETAVLGGKTVWGITPADPVGTTVRRISAADGNRIVVRNRFTYDPSMQVDQRRIDRVARDHDQSFAARFPMLGSLRMQYRWGGRLCLSRNNVSIVRELETGLYAACCQNGLGTTRGTLSGLLAAELAAGVTSERLYRALASEDPSKLPPRPLAKLGASVVLRWHELRAGLEL